jgi:hypothetical protein
MYKNFSIEDFFTFGTLDVNRKNVATEELNQQMAAHNILISF